MLLLMRRDPRPLCSVEGCERRRYALGMCSRHYERSYYARQRAQTQAHAPAPASGGAAGPLRVAER